jgi:hypothetical protein
MNFDQYAKTLGPSAVPDAANPLGASNAGVIGNFLKGGFLANASDRATAVGGAQAQVAAANAKAQEDYARKLQIQNLSDKAQTMQDQGNPAKYQKVGKADGGFNFFDGAGNPITVQQYSQTKGTTPKQVLANSDNSLDQQYIAHYKLTQDLSNAIVNNDAKARDKIYKANPGLQQATKGLTGQQILEQFIKAYPHVYGGNGPQTPLQSLGQDFGGAPPTPSFSPFNPSSWGPARDNLWNTLKTTLSGG